MTSAKAKFVFGYNMNIAIKRGWINVWWPESIGRLEFFKVRGWANLTTLIHLVEKTMVKVWYFYNKIFNITIYTPMNESNF